MIIDLKEQSASHLPAVQLPCKLGYHYLTPKEALALCGGQDKPVSHHHKKSTAIDKARSTSKKDQSELYIHGKDGKIQQKDSHGGDLYPPKG